MWVCNDEWLAVGIGYFLETEGEICQTVYDGYLRCA